MKKVLFILLLVMSSLNAQEEKVDMLMFEPVYNSYSGNKLSTLILENGEKVIGYKKDVDRKKGQIYYVKIQDSISGNEREFNADDIKEMYLFPGGLEKIGKVSNHLFDARRWESRDLESDLIQQGYIFFKKQNVSLKNKKDDKVYLMQLINPRFSKIIEVYGDPFANETSKFGIGGINVAGGLEKSYYIKKGDNIFWLEKKNLEDYYDELFGDNKEFVTMYPKKDLKWKSLGEYVYQYTKFQTKE